MTRSDISDLPRDQTGHVRVAIYDMDKTLTREATYNYFLWHMMWSRSPWRIVLTPALLFGIVMFGLKIWDRARLKTFSHRVLLGKRMSREAIAKHIERHADIVLDRNVYPEAKALVEANRADGYVPLIATASYRLYVEAIAARLGIDHVIATELHVDAKGRILAHIDGENSYDYAKLERVQRWFATRGLDRGECRIRAYSDHYSDAPLLTYADEGFAVNPHEKLATMAREKGWEILDWR